MGTAWERGVNHVIQNVCHYIYKHTYMYATIEYPIVDAMDVYIDINSAHAVYKKYCGRV